MDTPKARTKENCENGNSKNATITAKHDLENRLSNIANVDDGHSVQNIIKESVELQADGEVDDKMDVDEPVKLRDKKNIQPDSASIRKRRSRNLLLNRRSTGYVSVEEIEMAKSLEQLDKL